MLQPSTISTTVQLVGGWTNQAYWKICSPNWIISPGRAEHTNIWNRHLDGINEVESHIHSDCPNMVISVILAIHIQGDTRHNSSERWVILGGWVPKVLRLLVKLAYPGEFMEKTGSFIDCSFNYVTRFKEKLHIIHEITRHCLESDPQIYIHPACFNFSSGIQSENSRGDSYKTSTSHNNITHPTIDYSSTANIHYLSYCKECNCDEFSLDKCGIFSTLHC